jgi:hypothetical protein
MLEEGDDGDEEDQMDFVEMEDLDEQVNPMFAARFFNSTFLENHFCLQALKVRIESKTRLRARLGVPSVLIRMTHNRVVNLVEKLFTLVLLLLSNSSSLLNVPDLVLLKMKKVC